MTEALEKLFGKSARVLIKDGDFNKVEGQYHHYDYSQRITNNGCYNIIGNALHNVSNTQVTTIYHNRGARSMHHGATSQVATVDGSAILNNHASSSYHNPQSQVPNRSNPNPLSYGFLSPQSPGQYIRARSGNILEMSPALFASMNNRMAQMSQEMDSEFDNEMYDDDTSEDELSVTTKSQSLSAKINRLTIEEPVSSSPRSALIHGSSSTSVKADESPRHINIIPGDYTEVDDSFHQTSFNSHKVENNIIENSFQEFEGEQGAIVIQTTKRKLELKQGHVPRRR